ncbi:MAG TPA: hypothetical protein VL098_10225 [Flavipsychrobacter sp.]|nr:hypothetical protein [Flavipsychrobacter sp.]
MRVVVFLVYLFSFLLKSTPAIYVEALGSPVNYNLVQQLKKIQRQKITSGSIAETVMDESSGMEEGEYFLSDTEEDSNDDFDKRSDITIKFSSSLPDPFFLRSLSHSSCFLLSYFAGTTPKYIFQRVLRL